METDKQKVQIYLYLDKIKICVDHDKLQGIFRNLPGD